VAVLKLTLKCLSLWKCVLKITPLNVLDDMHTLQPNKDARLLVPFFFLQKEPARKRAQIARARVPTREKTESKRSTSLIPQRLDTHAPAGKSHKTQVPAPGIEVGPNVFTNG